MRAVTNEPIPESLLFEVLTPLGFRVRVTRTYWELIISIKHPAMAGRKEEVKKTLEHPEEIRWSRSDQECVSLLPGQRCGSLGVCGIEAAREEGFLITAYPTDAVKEGVHVVDG
jgi:hypothetical protein